MSVSPCIAYSSTRVCNPLGLLFLHLYPIHRSTHRAADHQRTSTRSTSAGTILHSFPILHQYNPPGACSRAYLEADIPGADAELGTSLEGANGPSGTGYPASRETKDTTRLKREDEDLLTYLINPLLTVGKRRPGCALTLSETLNQSLRALAISYIGLSGTIRTH